MYNSNSGPKHNFEEDKTKIMKVSFVSILMFLTVSLYGQTQPSTLNTMKLNAGIITDKFSETKKFYTEILDFGVTFENEFYLLLHTPNHQAELSFLMPNHPTQKPLFKPSFEGKGVYLTLEVKEVDKLYEEIKAKGIEIKIDIRDEPWGDRHFAIMDPNGIGIDIVTYSKPTEEN